MMTQKHPFAILSLAVALTLTACGMSKNLGRQTDGTATSSASSGKTAAFSPAAYLATVRSNESDEKALTSKVKVKIQVGQKSVSSTGTLRMKKDDVIQLSVVDPVVGIAELGRMEFTPTNVLIIDRFNKQYINVPYDSVSFLKRANIDFNSLQSLFWNEVFQPGKAEPVASAYTYTNTYGTAATPSDSIVNIGFHGPLLDYVFLTQQPEGTLECTTISSPKDQTAEFQCNYADFSNFSGRPFPHSLVMSFVMGKKNASLTFKLSSLRNNTNWSTRTPAPSRYTKADLEKIFRSLVK